MSRRPPRSTRTDTLFPYTTLFRSPFASSCVAVCAATNYLLAKKAMIHLARKTRYSPTCLLPAPPFPATAAMPVRRCSRSEEHTSELQSLMRISYAVFCLKKKKTNNNTHITPHKLKQQNEQMR